MLFNLLTIMFRIFILIDEKYVNDSLPFNNFLVKVSWIIKQIIWFNQRRVKAVLDAFFKNSNARAEDMYVQMASIVYIFQPSICLRLTATHGLKFSALESENIRAQLSWLKTIATLYTSFYLEPLRLLKIFVRHLSLIVSCLVLYNRHFEHRYHPCDKENRVVAKTFENIITEPGCLRCWGWFVGPTALHFYFDKPVK